MENTKLRNCPFCGSESAVVKAMNLIPTDYKVVCTSCGATAGWTDPKSEAIAAWNRCAIDDHLRRIHELADSVEGVEVMRMIKELSRVE